MSNEFDQDLCVSCGSMCHVVGCVKSAICHVSCHGICQICHVSCGGMCQMCHMSCGGMCQMCHMSCVVSHLLLCIVERFLQMLNTKVSHEYYNFRMKTDK